MNAVLQIIIWLTLIIPDWMTPASKLHARANILIITPIFLLVRLDERTVELVSSQDSRRTSYYCSPRTTAILCTQQRITVGHTG